jgi:hypothetical protein
VASDTLAATAADTVLNWGLPAPTSGDPSVRAAGACTLHQHQKAQKPTKAEPITTELPRERALHGSGLPTTVEAQGHVLIVAACANTAAGTAALWLQRAG